MPGSIPILQIIKRAEGEIIRILKRANKTVVGTFENSKYFGFVTSDNLKISGDIFIPKGEAMGAKHGQKVVNRDSEVA